MTRKDYVAIAEELRLAYLQATTHHRQQPDGLSTGEMGMAMNIAGRIADVFARDNGRFDRTRFLAACGMGAR